MSTDLSVATDILGDTLSTISPISCHSDLATASYEDSVSLEASLGNPSPAHPAPPSAPTISNEKAALILQKAFKANLHKKIQKRRKKAAYTLQKTAKLYIKNLKKKRESRIIALAEANAPVIEGRPRVLETPFEIALNQHLNLFSLTLEIKEIFTNHGLKEQIQTMNKRDIDLFVNYFVYFKNESPRPFLYNLLKKICGTNELTSTVFNDIHALFCRSNSFLEKKQNSVVIYTKSGGCGHLTHAKAVAEGLSEKGYQVSIITTGAIEDDPLVQMLGHHIPRKELYNYYQYLNNDSASFEKYREIGDKLRPYMPNKDMDYLISAIKLQNASAILINHALLSANAVVASSLFSIPVVAFGTDCGNNNEEGFLPMLEGYLTSSEYGLVNAYPATVTAPRFSINPVHRCGFKRPTLAEKMAARDAKGLREGQKYYLLTSGGLGSYAQVDNLKALLSQEPGFYETVGLPIKIKVICGKNEEVKHAIEKLLLTHSHEELEIEVVGYQSKEEMIQDHFAANAMIGKSGGSTSAECYATGLYLLAMRSATLTWENNNALYLKQMGLAETVNDTEALPIALKNLNEFTPTPCEYFSWEEEAISAIKLTQNRFAALKTRRKYREIELRIEKAYREENFEVVEMLFLNDDVMSLCNLHVNRLVLQMESLGSKTFLHFLKHFPVNLLHLPDLYLKNLLLFSTAKKDLRVLLDLDAQVSDPTPFIEQMLLIAIQSGKDALLHLLDYSHTQSTIIQEIFRIFKREFSNDSSPFAMLTPFIMMCVLEHSKYRISSNDLIYFANLEKQHFIKLLAFQNPKVDYLTIGQFYRNKPAFLPLLFPYLTHSDGRDKRALMEDANKLIELLVSCPIFFLENFEKLQITTQLIEASLIPLFFSLGLKYFNRFLEKTSPLLSADAFDEFIHTFLENDIRFQNRNSDEFQAVMNILKYTEKLTEDHFVLLAQNGYISKANVKQVLEKTTLTSSACLIKILRCKLPQAVAQFILEKHAHLIDHEVTAMMHSLHADTC